MKYKIDPIPGMPEWFTPGIVCRVRDDVQHNWNPNTRLCGYLPDANGLCFVDEHGDSWRFAEPSEQWEPQEGEWVAAWDGGDYFIVNKYKSFSSEGKHCTEECSWRHVARLQYPDGRAIDCACSVEELKGRTDWI